MGTNRGRFFRGVTFQIVALLVAVSGVKAQRAPAAGAVASGRSQHSGAASVAGSVQPLGLTDASHGTDQRGSGFFTSPAAQSNTVLNSGLPNEPFASVPGVAAGLTTSAGSGSAGSQGFSYTAPGDTFETFFQSNGAAGTGNDLFPSLVDILRSNLPGDPRNRMVPGGVGGTMDTSGANHFEAAVAPHWVLCRNSRYPITVTLPAQVIMGDDPYYFGHHYGWIAGGVNVRVPLSFIPKQCGKWSAGTSADLCYYGTTAAEFAKSLGLQVPKLGAALSLEL